MTEDEKAEDAADPRQLGGRRGARYGAVQAVYRWLMNAAEIGDVLGEARGWDHLGRADLGYLETLVRGVFSNRSELDQAIEPHLDRPLVQLDPMEHAVLLVGSWELMNCPELPSAVVINEAIVLSRLFGAEQAHKFVNGVLDKICTTVRRSAVDGRV